MKSVTGWALPAWPRQKNGLGSFGLIDAGDFAPIITSFPLPELESARLRDAGRKEKEAITYTGFIAQEVEKAAAELGFDFSGVDKPQNEHSLYGLRYAEFVVPLVKAVQEQQQQIEQQQQQIEQLRQEVAMLKAQGAVPVQQGTGGSVVLHADPNPFSESVAITINGKVSEGSMLVVRDHVGRTLRTLAVQGQRMELNTAGLAAGMYAVTLVVNGQAVASTQVVKE